MKAIVRISSIVLPFVFLVASARSEIVVSMRVEPESTLPSLPAAFLLTVTNPDSSPVNLLTSARLEVTPANGAPFLATWGRGETATGFMDAQDPIVIAAAATRELYIAFDDLLAEPQFFWDPRLSRPGRYLLRLQVFPLNPDDTLRTLVTNSVSLNVQTPEGPDADAYAMLLAIDPNWSFLDWTEGTGSAAAKIVQQHPRSSYAPYAQVLSGLSVEERLDVIDNALSTNVPRLTREYYLLLTKAKLLSYRSDQVTERDVNDAITDARDAREILARLIKSSPYAFVRDEAAKTMTLVKDPKDIPGYYRWYAEDRNAATEALSPFVQCVDTLGSSLVARFGYTNPNAAMKFLENGTGNRIEPKDRNLMPSRYFKPGRISGAAGGVSSSGRTITWYLDGNSAIATTDAPRCDPATAARLRPVLECARHENEGVVATFGYENPNRFAVVLPVGDGNRFDGQPNRGQPQIFYPGRHKNVFKTEVKDVSATWTLDGRSVTVTSRDSPVCSD